VPALRLSVGWRRWQGPDRMMALVDSAEKLRIVQNFTANPDALTAA